MAFVFVDSVGGQTTAVTAHQPIQLNNSKYIIYYYIHTFNIILNSAKVCIHEMMHIMFYMYEYDVFQLLHYFSFQYKISD